MSTNNNTECCPRFDPEPWDLKVITWDSKLFVKDHVTSVCHMPLNYGAVMTRSLSLINANGAGTPSRMILTDENSLWGAEVYFEVVKEVQGAKMCKLSGTFLSKVFEGPYRDIGKWIDAMKEYVASKGKNIQKMYFYYTTCPKCAKKYGKNYVVLLAEVESGEI